MAPGGRFGNSCCCCLLPVAGRGMFNSPSSCSGCSGAGVVGMSQSSVGGTTHLNERLSNTSIAGQRWRRGYPPWHCQYRLHDLPSGTLPLGSSLHRATGTHTTNERMSTLFTYTTNYWTTHGASDSRPHSQASRTSASAHYRADRQCITARWRCHSSTSNIGYRRSHVRRCRTTSHSVPRR